MKYLPPVRLSCLPLFFLTLGPSWHAAAQSEPALVINEVDYDQPGSDTAEFVELLNTATGSVALHGVHLVLVNGNDGSTYATVALPDVELAPAAYFVICADASVVPSCNLEALASLQNGAPDALSLTYVVGDSTLVLDALSYEGDVAPPYTEGSGAGLVDPGTSKHVELGLSRYPDGTDTDRNNVDFSLRCTTPGAANSKADAQCNAVDLRLHVTAEPSMAEPGGTVTYTFAYTGDDERDARDAELTVALPTFTHVDAATVGAGWTDQGNGLYTIELGTLAAGRETTVHFTAVIDDPLPAGLVRTIATATLTATEPEKNPDDNVSGATTQIANPSRLVINEVDYDQPGSDTAEFVELKNTGSTTLDLAHYQLGLVNGSSGTVYGTVDLPAVRLAPGNYYVVCGNTTSVPNCDLGGLDAIQNGAPDAVALLLAGTDPAVVDVLSYEGTTSPPYREGPGTGLEDSGRTGSEEQGLSRFPDGIDTDHNNVDFSVRCVTPGARNATHDDRCAEIDLELDHTVDRVRPHLFDVVTFTLKLTNQGARTATGVEVTNRLPDALELVEVRTRHGHYEGGTGRWYVGQVSPGDTVSLQLDTRVLRWAYRHNRAEVTAADQPDSDSTPGDGQGDDYATAGLRALAADVELSISAAATAVAPASEASFTLQIRNRCCTTTTGVAVHIAPLAGLTLIDLHPSSGRYDPSTGRWEIASIAAGDAAALTLLARVETVADFILAAEVVASDLPDPDSTPGNDVQDEDDMAHAHVTSRIADVGLRTSVDRTTVARGMTVTYTLSVFNDGPLDAPDVVVEDLFPKALAVEAAYVTVGSCTVESQSVRCSADTLTAGDSLTAEIVTRVVQTGTFTNKARVGAGLPDVNPSNDTDSVTVTAPAPPPAPHLLAPADGMAGLSSPVRLLWEAATHTTSYELQVALDDAFEHVVFDEALTADTTGAIVRVASGADFAWRVRARNIAGAGPWSPVFNFSTARSVGVAEASEGPTSVTLGPNHPNPFRAETRIHFALPSDGSISLEVYDMLGRRIATLLDGQIRAGRYEIAWRPTYYPPGVYLVRLRTGETLKTLRITNLH